MVTGTTVFWMDIATEQACAENRATNNGLLATVVTAVGWQNRTHCSWLLLFIHAVLSLFLSLFPLSSNRRSIACSSQSAFHSFISSVVLVSEG